MEVQKAYQNIETIITHGFLMASLRVSDTSVVLKNMTDKEYRILTMLDVTGLSDNESLWNMVYCTVFVGGHNFLVSREGELQGLLEFYRNSPISFAFFT